MKNSLDNEGICYRHCILLTMVHNDQGLTQLRRFCETVGAASQISYMLIEDFHFYLQTDTWICYRHFIKEVISSATTVHTDQFIIWCNFSRQVTNANMVSQLHKMIWNNKSESFSRLQLYYERCSSLNQWWKTKSKSSVCSSHSIKCKQSNDTKRLEKIFMEEQPRNKPIVMTHLVLCRVLCSVLWHLIFGLIVLQFPQS